MRRVAVLAALVAVVIVTQSFGVRAADDGRVDVVFDTAKGLLAGQAVKIAGAPVGTIAAVRLQSGPRGVYRARVSLRVERRFLPFRADARCRILPQGLLSENYVDCDPGSPRAAPLVGRIPIVPVERTSVPVGLQDVLNTFDLPTSQRLRLVVNTLGAGLAGRGQDLRQLLRRAFPALDATDRALRVVNTQRTTLRTAITQSDRILTALAARDQDIRGLVDRAAAVARTTGSRSADLEASVRRLPPLLDALDATLPAVRRVAKEGTPVLHELRRAAPQVDGFTRALGAFEAPALPALRALKNVARTGRSAVVPARPLARDLRRLVARTEPVARSLDRLLSDTRANGGADGLLSMLYTLSVAPAAFDRVGHEIPLIVNVTPRCIVASMQPGTQVAPGCSHALSSPGLGRIPITQLPPANATAGRRVSSKSVSALLDYLLR